MKSIRVTELSDFKIAYLEDFKKRNTHLSIPPQKIYNVVKQTLSNLSEPITQQEFLDFYNGNHEYIINLPDQKQSKSVPDVDTDSDEGDKLKKVNQPPPHTKEILEFPEDNVKVVSNDSVANEIKSLEQHHDEPIKPNNLQNTKKPEITPAKYVIDNQVTNKTEKFKKFFPDFWIALILVAFSIIQKYNYSDVEVVMIHLVLVPLIYVWCWYALPLIISTIIKFITGKWSSGLHQGLVRVYIAVTIMILLANCG